MCEVTFLSDRFRMSMERISMEGYIFNETVFYPMELKNLFYVTYVVNMILYVVNMIYVQLWCV